MSTEVNKERVQLWVDALRSGLYAQGRGNLAIFVEDGTRYCCLGVACEVAIANDLFIEVEERCHCMSGEEEYCHPGRVKAYDGHEERLPRSVASWYGFPEEMMGNPLLTGGSDAIWLNDEERRTFHEIADAISARYGLGEE